MSLKELQKEILENKLKQGFNTTDIYLEFCYIQVELAEAIEAYSKKKKDLPEELADIAIYLLGLSEILGFDLGKEIEAKMKKNVKRKYQKVNGVLKRIK
jgi:NTP pyrophosphatase (non-canonical NTP hydrolase)